MSCNCPTCMEYISSNRTALLEKIQQAINLLDMSDLVGSDWRDLINLEILDIEDPDLCILGQIFGSWHGSEAQEFLNDVYDTGCQQAFSAPLYTSLWVEVLTPPF